MRSLIKVQVVQMSIPPFGICPMRDVVTLFHRRGHRMIPLEMMQRR